MVLMKKKTIKIKGKSDLEITYHEIYFTIQGLQFNIETLYQNMLCMCGGHYNSAFSEFEKRRIDEVVYLFLNWQKVHKSNDDKPKTNLENNIYEPLE